MRSPAEVRAWARRRYRSRRAAWLATTDLGAGEGHACPLHPPGEASAAADPDALVAWVRSWRAFEASGAGGVRVVWAGRRWRSLGTQQLPVRVEAAGAEALARLAGESEWPVLVERARRLGAAWPHADLAAVLPGMATKLALLGDADVDRLVAVATWLAENPASGLLPRQIPVAGVDTKWLERHRDLTSRCVAGLTGSRDLGLREPEWRFRIRVLDAALASGVPDDLTASVATLSTLPLTPTCVLLVENVASVAALPPLPGTVAVHGQGIHAPELAAVGWIAASRVLYWGDLDTHGFRILGDVRRALPHTESVLMDAGTWNRFEHLAGREAEPYRSRIGHLTAPEQEALVLVRAGDRRLEQERLGIDHVNATLARVTAGCR